MKFQVSFNLRRFTIVPFKPFTDHRWESYCLFSGRKSSYLLITFHHKIKYGYFHSCCLEKSLWEPLYLGLATQHSLHFEFIWDKYRHARTIDTSISFHPQNFNSWKDTPNFCRWGGGIYQFLRVISFPLIRNEHRFRKQAKLLWRFVLLRKKTMA